MRNHTLCVREEQIQGKCTFYRCILDVRHVFTVRTVQKLETESSTPKMVYSWETKIVALQPLIPGTTNRRRSVGGIALDRCLYITHCSRR